MGMVTLSLSGTVTREAASKRPHVAFTGTDDVDDWTTVPFSPVPL